MSTTTGPDLTAAREAVERLMDDTIQVSSVVDADQWELNPDTLELVPPAGTVLYSGRAKVKPLGNGQQNQTEEGGLVLGLDGYRVDIPIDAPFLPEGSTVLLTSSRRFVAAVGAVFVVQRLTVKTLAVQASYAVERRAQIGLGAGTAPVPTGLYPSFSTYPRSTLYPIGSSA